MTSDGRTSSVSASARVAEAARFEDLDSDVLERAGLPAFLARVETAAREIDARHLRTGFTQLQSAQLVRYQTGGHYLWHKDANVTRYRKLTAIVYLTDARSHGLVGGETIFAPWRFQRRWKPVCVSPERGWAVFFDSRIPHRALPTRAGTKIVFVPMFV